MKKILLILANLIALTCAMRSWVFNFPPRIFIYDVLMALFIVIWLLGYARNASRGMLNNELKTFLIFIWGYFAIQVISGISVLLSHDTQKSFLQYYRALISNGVFSVFATFLYMFLSELRARERKQILTFYIAGVVLSSLYGIIGSIIYELYGFQIESYIWPYLSYNPGTRFDDGLTWAVLGIRRGVGFPGVNAAASYNMTVLPMLLLYSLFRGRLKDYLLLVICFTGLLVTLSRTGFVSLAVSLLIMIVMLFKNMKNALLKLALLALPVIVLACTWSKSLSEVAHYRPLRDASRTLQWESGLQLFSDNPLLGVGANNFSFARETLASEFYHDANLHNSWLTILVELGLLGLVCYTLFFFFILKCSFRRRNPLSRGYICALLGLATGALGNQLFDTFYFNFFLVFFFALVILRNEEDDPAHLMPEFRDCTLCSDSLCSTNTY